MKRIDRATLVERVPRRERAFFPKTLQKIVTGELRLPVEQKDGQKAQSS